MEDLTFTENTVQIFGGGGLFWQRHKPIDTNMIFSNNYAPIGPNFASRALNVIRINDRLLADEIETIPSGQQAQIVLEYEIIDGYG